MTHPSRGIFLAPPAFAGVLAVLTLAAGCGGDRLEVVPVEGRVTQAGGGWGRPGLIYFAPVDPAPGFPRLPGMGEVDTEGRFRATTQPNRNGLVPGKYRVCFDMWEVPPTMGGPPPKSYLPKKYQAAATSGLEIDVPADASGPVEVSWDIPKR
ncbi:MAG: hypothetical protein ACRCT8_16365 [Lacipirellulaceae bacterium]